MRTDFGTIYFLLSVVLLIPYDRKKVRAHSNLAQYHAEEVQCSDNAEFRWQRNTRPVRALRFYYIGKSALPKDLQEGSSSSRI